MPNPAKGRSAADRADEPVGSRTINQFCARHHFSRAFYFAMRKAGLGPVEMRIGGLVRISDEAERAWQHARENPAGADIEQHKAELAARGSRAGHKAAQRRS
jgi:hypothetical protein